MSLDTADRLARRRGARAVRTLRSLTPRTTTASIRPTLRSRLSSTTLHRALRTDVVVGSTASGALLLEVVAVEIGRTELLDNVTSNNSRDTDASCETRSYSNGTPDSEAVQRSGETRSDE